MLNQKKVEIFSRKFHKSLAKQFLEVALIFGIPWWLAHLGVVEMVLWIRFFTSVEDENFGCKTSVFFIGRKIKLHHEEILTASGGKYFSIGTENMEMSGNDFTCNKPTIY
jgi:hypothetical protein